MSTLTYALSDSTTMIRRNLLRMVRYPSMTLLLVGILGEKHLLEVPSRHPCQNRNRLPVACQDHATPPNVSDPSTVQVVVPLHR